MSTKVKPLDPEKYVHFERIHLCADFLDDPYAFMTEDHVGVLEELVGAAQTCVGDFEEDFVRGEGVLVSLGLDDPSGFLALVYGVIQIQLGRHRDGFWGRRRRGMARYLSRGFLMMS